MRSWRCSPRCPVVGRPHPTRRRAVNHGPVWPGRPSRHPSRRAVRQYTTIQSRQWRAPRPSLRRSRRPRAGTGPARRAGAAAEAAGSAPVDRAGAGCSGGPRPPSGSGPVGATGARGAARSAGRGTRRRGRRCAHEGDGDHRTALGGRSGGGAVRRGSGARGQRRDASRLTTRGAADSRSVHQPLHHTKEAQHVAKQTE